MKASLFRITLPILILAMAVTVTACVPKGQSGGARFDQGALLAQSGNHAQAVAEFDAAIAAEPTLRDAWLARAHSLAMVGDHARAVHDLDKAIQLDPTDHWAYGSRAVSYAHIHRHAEAVADFTKLLAARPGHRAALMGRALARIELTRYQAALADLDEAITLDPANPVPHYYRARCLTALNRDADAAKAYLRINELDPTGAERAKTELFSDNAKAALKLAELSSGAARGKKSATMLPTLDCFARQVVGLDSRVCKGVFDK